MEVNTVLNGKKKKGLFDSLSDEFNRTEIADKLISLSSLNYFGLLETAIQDYKKAHEDIPHVLRNLKPTLTQLISYVRFGDTLHVSDMQSLKLKELVTILGTELKKNIAVHFSMDKLVESYLSENMDDFKYQNKFFRTNFLKDITEEVEKRDVAENKQYFESYSRLYIFLNNHLIKDYRSGEFIYRMIDMGMDYQTQQVVKYYLENPSKENYFRAIKYCLKVLYFGVEPYH